MARATRSKPKAKEATPEPPVSTAKPLPTPAPNPPKLFVLPKDTSPDARIVTLDNPATATPSRYLFCPTRGFYEFTRVAAPKSECRSWLLTSAEQEEEEEGEGEEEVNGDEERIGTGYVTKSADMFIATPIDILFLLLPVLAPKSAKDAKQHFLALDDYTDSLAAGNRHWKVLLAQHPSLARMIEQRVRAVCDSVDAAGETMYRLNAEKVAALLLKKAERMVAHGLPKSLEEKFIKTALEVPIMSVATDETSPSPSTLDTATTPPDEKQDATITPPLATPPQITHLLRLRTCLTYLSTTYLPPALLPRLPTPTFPALTTHLAALATLKQTASALRSLSDNMSRKRAVAEDDDRIAARDAKKRKKEDDDRKKKAEGRGVKMLKKADTSGMKKMSAFFVKVDRKK
ncbi:ribonuclease H2, subunit B [Ampelomyces quisqualis]|uniref:Ribonuclease H2 subunit B n=1 Tax=Ampelomyces quisqualis TaxID=50730 RepID=A0A6A5QZ99_AMPQU|nr:ribonuclease H2, subunit B [Ampelomyces quisqualis]